MKVWLIARGFPPINTIGAERPKKFLRFFLDLNYEVTVFTVAQPTVAEVDLIPCIEVRRSVQLLDGTKWSQGFIATSIKRVISYLMADSGWLWIAGLRKDLNQALASSERPDVVIATGQPFATFIPTAIFCKAHAIPLVLDYRDAWASNAHQRFRFNPRALYLGAIEKWINKRAAAITTVSKLTARAIKGSVDPLVLYNFPDQGYVAELEELTLNVSRAAVDRTQLRVVFAGMLYPGRELDPICEAISQLADAEKVRIQFIYCGSSSARAKSSFRKFGVEAVLNDFGVQSKAQAVSLIKGADIALSVIASVGGASTISLRGVVTTKIFDHIILRKRTMNIVPTGFEVGELLNRFSIRGVDSVEPENINGIVSLLRTYLKRKQDSDNSFFELEPQSSDLVAEWQVQMNSFDGLLLESVAQSA